MRRKGLRGIEHDLWPIGDELAPGILPRIVDSGRDQPKRAAARIGANVEDPAGWVAARAAKVAGMVIDVVFVIVFARRDQAELRVRLIGGKEAGRATGGAGRGVPP